MALEAVVFQQDLFSYGHLGGGGAWSYGGHGGHGFEDEKAHVGILDKNAEQVFNANWDSSPSSKPQNVQEIETNAVASTPENYGAQVRGTPAMEVPPATTGRRKRRRTRIVKNEQEVENQRMTHIAVERNRRKQMNEYLSVLRSMMPASYVQRGDQASIVGGTINFVKQLEQLLQSLEAQKHVQQQANTDLFSSFFTFPQYSMYSNPYTGNSVPATGQDSVAEIRSAAIANVEVTMVESHANIKLLSKRRPKQLLKVVVGLHRLHLMVLHLNVTTVEHTVLYCFSVKIEEECQMTSVNEIAAAVYDLVVRIQEEGSLVE